MGSQDPSIAGSRDCTIAGIGMWIGGRDPDQDWDVNRNRNRERGRGIRDFEIS